MVSPDPSDPLGQIYSMFTESKANNVNPLLLAMLLASETDSHLNQASHFLDFTLVFIVFQMKFYDYKYIKL